MSNAEAVVQIVVCDVVSLVARGVVRLAARDVVRLAARDVVLQLSNGIAEAVVLVVRLVTRWRWPEHEQQCLIARKTSKHQQVTRHTTYIQSNV